MTELINQASEILSQGKELIENPQIKEAVSGIFSFMKNAFGSNKRAKDRLETIEKEGANEELLNQIKTSIVLMTKGLDDGFIHEATNLSIQTIVQIRKLWKEKPDITPEEVISKLQNYTNC